ncbi:MULTISPECIES: ImmA/IrrE family metallo-endopeptidase [Microbacterium]|uniref:ImmA/IrrE family metallo-endopeptidase n=1 Tax=Microbacterium sufflavum TaxID=2851649 RepID=A0ABY4IFP3_9MICO|nr:MULTISPECIES: ImmA/IrrE family metallo-endopeptidase [Microbacterium]UPL10475.1 ImmA/IrrE family metallo-endopeptidase [Microbacterium sufflavum]
MNQLFEELEVECGAMLGGLADRVSVLLGVDIEVDVLGEREWASIPPFALVNGDRARIPVRESDPRWYQLHVVAHELAHLLCGHAQCAMLPMTFDGPQRPAAVDVAASDVPRQQEREAEELARRLSAFMLAPRFEPVLTVAC